MSEKLIYLDDIDPIHIYGVNNSKLRILQTKFPKLKIVGRGSEIKVIGEKSEINFFYGKLIVLMEFYNRFNSLTDQEIEQIISDDSKDFISSKKGESDVIVFGNNGKLIKAKSANQRKLVNDLNKNDLIITYGPAGSGKTYMAIALAVRALKEKQVKRIILTRPVVEAGEHLGFLPGDIKEKLDPYLQPIYDALHDMIPSKKLIEFLDEGIIQIAPLAYMRGRTLNDAFAILDEAQNATHGQLKMFLTRMGINSKFIVTGDLTQIDLPSKQHSGLKDAIEMLDNVEGISIVEFQAQDIVRHKLVKKIVDAYNKKIK